MAKAMIYIEACRRCGEPIREEVPEDLPGRELCLPCFSRACDMMCLTTPWQIVQGLMPRTTEQEEALRLHGRLGDTDEEREDLLTDPSAILDRYNVGMS